MGNYFNKITNNHGMTLMSVLVAAVLGTILVGAIATGISQMYNAQRSVNMASNSNAMYGEWRLGIQSPTECSQMMVNRPYIPGGESPLNNLPASVNGVTVQLVEGQEVIVGSGIFLDQIRLATNTLANEADTITLRSGGINYRYSGAIRIRTHRVGMGSGSTETLIPMNFIGDTKGPGLITDCASSTASQSICEAMHYVWDASQNPPKCMPANECQYGGSYADPMASTSVGGFDNPLTNGRSCPAGFSAMQSGSISYAANCGKGCINTTVYPTYQCLMCLDGKGNPQPLSGSTLAAMAVGFDVSNQINASINFLQNQSGVVNGVTTTTTTTTIPPTTTTTQAPIACPARTVSWAINRYMTCSGSAPNGVANATASIANTAARRTGSAIFTCKQVAARNRLVWAWVYTSGTCK